MANVAPKLSEGMPDLSEETLQIVSELLQMQQAFRDLDDIGLRIRCPRHPNDTVATYATRLRSTAEALRGFHGKAAITATMLLGTLGRYSEDDDDNEEEE